MYRPNTVFILGAGASHEAGLPVGWELTAQISQRLSRGVYGLSIASQNFLVSLASQEPNPNRFDIAARQIGAEIIGHNSIDQYVDIRDDPVVSLVAKLAIVDEIKLAESQSTLFKKSSNQIWINNAEADNTWYDAFFRAAHERVKSNNLAAMFQNVAVVNFNYDRTLELFLELRIQQFFGSMTSNARELVAQLKILRPYGGLGPLVADDPLRPTTKFGHDEFREISSAVPNQIRTFSELALSDVQEQITEVINQAEIVVFLGFGFHPQNMDILKRTVRTPCPNRAFATAFRASTHDIDAHRRAIRSTFGMGSGESAIIMEDKPANDFLRDIAKSLR